MPVTVKDLFNRPYFENASIIAGQNGLNREVKWVHIVEIARFGHLLNGNEVILSTGIGWAHDEEKSISYLEQLLEYNAAALCIELAVHIKDLPQKMLEFANEHNFPIIAFHEEVRFIDITKDLHELLIGVHEDVWWNLEQLQQKMQHTLTSNSVIADFLKVIHQETNKQIALYYDHNFRFFPSPSRQLQEEWIEKIEENNEYFSQAIYLLSNQIGKLYYIEDKNSITQFDELAIKKCGEILTQYFWRSQRESEEKRMSRNKWILDSVYGKVTHEEIINKIREEQPHVLINNAIIGVKPYHTSLLIKEQEVNSETTSIMFLRTFLTEFGFELFTVKDNARHYYILLLLNKFQDNFLTRLKRALHKLHEDPEHLHLQNDLQWLSFGKVVQDLSELPSSYETAISTLAYQQKIKKLPVPFYKELTVYRLIDQMSSEKDLEEIVMDFIGPLIEHDKAHNSELRHTLHVYLKNFGSKNASAEELHIVRQTLYHRLQRIEELLGKDYLDAKKRFMIEFSLNAYEFLQ